MKKESTYNIVITFLLSCLFLLFTSLFFTPLLQADQHGPAFDTVQGGAAGDNVVDSAKALLVKLKEATTGELDYRYFGYFHATKNDKRINRNETYWKFDSDFYKGDWQFHISPELEAADDDYVAGVTDRPYDRKIKDRKYFNLNEAYIAYSGESYDLTIGKKIFSWGTATIYNPSDRINHRDLMNPLNARKYGDMAIVFNKYAGEDLPVTLTFGIIPYFSGDKQPPDTSRWSGSPDDDNASLREFDSTDGISNVHVNEHEFPTIGLRNTQFMSKVKTTYEGWDMFLGYYRGFEKSSLLEKDADTADTYTPRFSRIHIFSGGFSTAFEKISIHGEFAYQHTVFGTDDSFLSYVAGLTYTYYDLPRFIDFLENIHMELEYSGEAITRQMTDEDYVASSTDGRGARNSLLGFLKFKYDEDTNLKYAFQVNFNDGDSLQALKLTHKFTGNVKMEANLNYLTGPKKGSFYGRWWHNDGVNLLMTYSF